MNRVFEIILALFLLAVLLPIFAIITILIIIDDPGQPFFIQSRMGKNFEIFNLIKFRTMRNVISAKGSMVTIETDSRITVIGRILRKTKIDELPQIINVLKGDMSFVGPRPELIEHINYYKKDYKDILSVRPGMTDFAAIQYINEQNILANYLDYHDIYIKEILPNKIILYKKYLREKCLMTDIKLILLTITKLFGRSHDVLGKYS